MIIKIICFFALTFSSRFLFPIFKIQKKAKKFDAKFTSFSPFSRRCRFASIQSRYRPPVDRVIYFLPQLLRLKTTSEDFSPFVRAGRIFTFVSSSLIFTPLPRDRIYIRRIIITAFWWNHENFPPTNVNELTGRSWRAWDAKRRNEYEINSIPRKMRMHVCKSPLQLHASVRWKPLRLFPVCRLFHLVF